jgi:hypothetical protein
LVLSRGQESVVVQDPHSVEGVLRSVEKNVFNGSLIADHAQFVLALGRLWKDRGGKVAGKLRHSDRQLNELLKKQGTIVRSLTPKLAGKTKLKPDDGTALLRLFLTHWNYMGEGPNEGGVQSEIYRPISNTEIEEVRRQIADWLSEDAPDDKTGADGDAPPQKASVDTTKLIPREFKDSDALFTISTQQTIITAAHAVVDFKDLLNALFDIDHTDRRGRILVWILDLGALDYADPQASPRFLNVDELASRFRALRLFKEPIAEARWNWLQSRALFVLHEPQVGGHQAAELPALTAHHFLFDAVPTSWAKSSEFRTLYGAQLERLDERNYSIFLNRSAGESSLGSKLRYFGHAQVMSDGKDERWVHGLELPAPGGDHEIAFETVYAAATYVLRINANLTKLPIDGRHATAALGRLGFSLLRLDEFMNLWLRPFSTAAA